jgi:hypothetical protein
MRTSRLTIISLIALACLASYGYTSAQSSAQRQNAGPGECATSGVDSPVTARLRATGDITSPGIHKVWLKSVSTVVIRCSSLPGRTITIPPNLIHASFAITNGPPEAAGSLRFQITSSETTVESFNFPSRGRTGLNVFKILKGTSYVQVTGLRGKGTLTGQAEATLSNRLFLGGKALPVRIIFKGVYDFRTKTATLTQLEAHAHS